MSSLFECSVCVTMCSTGKEVPYSSNTSGPWAHHRSRSATLLSHEPLKHLSETPEVISVLNSFHSVLRHTRFTEPV